MKEYARKLYSSKAWKKTRSAYAKSRGGLCERCLTKGLIIPGEIVHHRRHITAGNVDKPEITLSWDNLQLVCRECHAEIHERDIHGSGKKSKKRYKVNADGKVTATEAPPI
ncbi:MAG: HNH endonuclease [Oscillospiraceae bacterium]|nr:HNH endonuclease [Oscillospiraceae bacterium]